LGRKFEKAPSLVGILHEITGNKWGRIYRFKAYFRVFE